MSVCRSSCSVRHVRRAATLLWLLVLLADTCGTVAQEVSIAVIHSFTNNSASVDGIRPGKLALGSDGSLYGTTAEGGPGGGGTIFRMTMAGAITTLHAFKGRDGLNPDDCLIPGADGAFYGTTSLTPRTWNDLNRPSVFRITPQGEFNTVYVYPWDDADPFDVVVKGVDGQAYGVRFGQNASFALIGDKRFAATLPSVRVVRRKTPNGPLPLESLFTQVPSEPVSMQDPPPATFGGRPKQPLCGGQVADLYGRVWGPAANPVSGVGAIALYKGDWRGPEAGLVAWFTRPNAPAEKNPDFAKVLTFHGQHIPAPDGGVYALAGSEVVHVTREGRAPTLLSLAALLEQRDDGRDQEVQGLIIAADGYVYGQVVSKRTATTKMFRFRLDGPLEILKLPPGGAPTPHLTDLVELDDGSFVGPAGEADGKDSVIIRIAVRG
jgi:uncharacterized repeat protein (TIGR03803 family)